MQAICKYVYKDPQCVPEIIIFDRNPNFGPRKPFSIILKGYRGFSAPAISLGDSDYLHEKLLEARPIRYTKLQPLELGLESILCARSRELWKSSLKVLSLIGL